MQPLSFKISHKISSLLVSLILLGYLSSAKADDTLVDPGQITFREAISDLPSEKIDPYTGHLDLTYTDLHLPGDGGLDLQIFRTYKSTRVTDMATAESKLGYGWDIHFGKAKSNDDNHITIELQDGTNNTAVRETGGSNNFLTKDFWKLSMSSGYPVLQLTDGTKITFGKATSTNWFMATEIRKNNNTLAISYNSFETIDKVTYKAGGSSKTIQFNYAASGKKHLQSITWGPLDIWGKPSGQILYTYPADDKAIDKVQLPGGDIWKYNHQLQYLNLREAYILQTITTPWGGTVSYAFNTINKPCGVGIKTQGSLSSKQVSGRGLENGTWSYAYKVESGYDSTVITDSCGRTTTHKFFGYGSAASYNNSCYKYGMPMSKTVMNGAVQEEAATYQWDKLSTALSPIADSVLCVCSDLATYVPVMTSEIITRGGKTYSTSYSNFDAFGSPKKIIEQGSNTRTKTLTYWYDTGRNMVKDKPLTITTTGDSQFPGTFTTNYSYHNNVTYADYYGEIKTVEPNGVVTTYSYDDNGNISGVTDANTHTTTFLWDHGTVSKITNPYYSINRVINWDGTVASETNGRGYTTTYEYDKAMRPTEVTPPTGNPTVSSYEYDGSDFFTSKKEQRGLVYTRISYDGLGRQSGTSNALGVTTDIAYSPCCLKKSTSTNIGDTSLFDHFGRPTQITHKDGTKRVHAYPDDSHLQITDEENFVEHHYFKFFGKPGTGLLSQVVDANSQTTGYTYNSLGSLIQAQGVGRTDSYGYDLKNFLTSETHPESGTTNYTRDNVGNLKTIQDSLGTRTSTYDDINRLRSISSSAGGTLSYDYDNADNMTSSQSPDSSATQTYDGSNRVTGTTTTTQGIAKTVSYGYDVNDNLTSITYPNSLTVNYGYNSLNQVTSVSGFGGDIHNIIYNTSGTGIGLMHQYTRSNGQVVSYSYDNRRRPSRSTYPATDLGYNFNVRGNLKDHSNYKDRSKDKAFDYDGLNRLTIFNGPWGNGQYSYESSGDRTSKRIGAATTAYSYTNHLLSGSNYSFNGDGDMIRNGDTSFEYDGFHHLKRALRNSVLATYGYDGDKQRVYKVTDDSTTIYFKDAKGNTLSELTGNGTPLESFIYLGDKLLAKVLYNRLGDVFRDGKRDLVDTILGLQVLSGGTTEKPLFLASDIANTNKIGMDEVLYDLGVLAGLKPSNQSEMFFYDTDYLGTPIALSNSTGNVVWQADELPFGEDFEEGGIADINSRRYIGKEKDKETELLYFGARFLAAPNGRFTSADPVGLVDAGSGKINAEMLGDPQRLNRYAYGLNNPYKYVDPDGRDAILVEYRGYKVDTGFGFKLPLGHSAVIAVDSNSGLTNYFEYGRYGGDFGKVRQMSVPNLEMKDGRPTEKSTENLYKYISEHYGQNKPVDATYYNDADSQKTVNFASERMNNPKREPYDKFFNNCKTFAADAVKAGKEQDNKRKNNK
jgi:RHS repeat-associated protein